MKKNIMMRLASGLLVAVLLSTCAISGTFAKYVTTASGSDTARVAKWGVEVSANFDNLFSETYTTTKAWEGDDGNSVVSSGLTTTDSAQAGEDVVAPGTNGTLADFTVTGTPEVDVAVTYDATLTLSGWEIDITDDQTDNATEYCPIIITVNSTDYYIGATVDETKITTVAGLKTAVEAAIENSAKNYNANTDLSDDTNVAADLAVSWKWEFEGDAANATLSNYQTDVKDTALGDAAAEQKAATIKLEVSCSITQID